MITWLGTYAAHTPGVEGGSNSSLLLDDQNEVQPDSLLMISPDRGGQASLDERGYLVMAPELVGEVSVSTVSYDLHDKMTVYKRHHVREYVVWRVADRAVDWFVLHPDRHEPLPPDERGIIKSVIFPGLWLDVQALVADDMRRVLDVLHEGIGSSDHQDFVRKLSNR
jgi:Uma2 family endonuclease